jgi:hypothetical protein
MISLAILIRLVFFIHTIFRRNPVANRPPSPEFRRPSLRGLHWKLKRRGETRPGVLKFEELLAAPPGVSPASATEKQKH